MVDVTAMQMIAYKSIEGFLRILLTLTTGTGYTLVGLCF